MPALRLIPVCLGLALFACGDGSSDGSGPEKDATAPFGSTGGDDSGGGEPAGGSGGEPVGAPGGNGGAGGGDGGPGGGQMDASSCVCARGVCDPAGACVEASPCASDTECLAGRLCEGGTCQPGCADDAACAANGRASRCVESRCIECANDGECFGRSTCDVATGLCLSADMCQDSRECVGAEVCNGRTGMCAPPAGCDAESCPAGRVCDEAIGRCVYPPNCEGNAECPSGQVCPAGRDRQCRACADDVECGGTLRCVGGLCAEDAEAGCAADSDCQNGRVCTAGACTPPACEDDADEPNDTADLPTSIPAAQVEASACAANDDWYAVELPSDNAATVVATVIDGTGDLALEVQDDQGNVLASSNGVGLVEAVVVGPYNVDRGLRIRVHQPVAPSSLRYTLAVELAAEVGCNDDAVDNTVGDDDVASARALRPAGAPPIDARLDGRSCGVDEDWFCLQVENGESLSVEGSVNQGNLRLSAAIVPGAGGEPLSEVEWARGQAAAPLTAPRSGAYCIRLRPVSGEGAWSMRVSTNSRALAELCSAAEQSPTTIDVGGTTQLTGELGEEDVFDASCAAGERDGGEGVHVVDVLRPGLLVARVAGRAGGTLGDPVLSVRGECASALSELACVDDGVDPEAPGAGGPGPTEVRLPLEQAGAVTIAVGGIAPGERPTYALDVEVRPLSAPPMNEDCDRAADIVLVNGVANLVANLDRARDDVVSSCATAGGPDAVWRLNLDTRSRVAVRLDADFAVSASLVAACGRAAEACGPGFDDASVAAGEWLLVLDGYGPQARGRVNAQVTVVPDAEAPANEVCGSAEVLAPAGGTLEGDTSGAVGNLDLPDGNRCTGFNASGGDVAYRIAVTAGRRYAFTATPIGGWDLSLYVLRDACDNPVAQCVAGSDGALEEQVEFDAAETEELSVIIDGANGERGPFQLEWTVEE